MCSIKVNCEEVYHFGIKGMHWGIRRTPEELGRKKEYPRDKKSIKQMSDQELQSKINRLQKEKQYKELTKNPVLSGGKKIVIGILSAVTIGALTDVLKNESSSVMRQGIDLVKKAVTR